MKLRKKNCLTNREKVELFEQRWRQGIAKE